MPEIVNYNDYRQFLEDFYLERKAEDRRYSYQMLSKAAGIKSKGFLHNVIKGRRNLPPSNVVGLAHAMKLSAAETAFFEALVALNDATTLRDRSYHYERLLAVKGRGRGAWQPQVVRKHQYRFYQHHYHSVIRSLIEMYGFQGDYGALAEKVWPRITVKQARESVELLLTLGLIRKNAGGRYAVTNKCISTSGDISETMVQNFHAQAGKLALKALDRLPAVSRNMSALTLGISAKTYAAMCDEVATFRHRLLELAEEDEEADSVYQLNLQFFPVSRQATEEGTK